MAHTASAITAPKTDHLPAYWQFHAAVTRAQLTTWLPPGRHLIVDVSGPRGPGAELAARAGHTVLRVLDGVPPCGASPDGARAWSAGRIIPVIADSTRLSFLADGCADDVIADDRALSMHLGAETMIAEIARVLRPSGRVLASAITEAVIEERLRPRGVPETMLASLHELFQTCNLARYAPIKTSQELAAIIPKLEAVLRELQALKP